MTDPTTVLLVGEDPILTERLAPAIERANSELDVELAGRADEALEHSEALGLWFVHWVLDRSGGRFEIERTPDGHLVALVLRCPDGDGSTPDR